MLAVYCCQGHALVTPPVQECTRFQYDVQLLEKILRFEQTIELMEERLKNCLQGWDAKETKLMSEIKALSESLKTDQEAKLQSLETTQSKMLADTKTEMNIYMNQTIDSIKGQRKRPTVYFYYSRTAKERLSNGEAMRFINVLDDTHRAYDNTTGCFTAPLPGVYTFGMQLGMKSGKTVRADIRVNGRLKTFALLYKSAYRSTTNMNLALLLKSEDIVCIKAGSLTDSGLLIDDIGYSKNFLYGTLVG